MLDLKFAYSTNGPGIVEHDYTTGLDTSSTRTRRRTSCGAATARARGVDPDDPQLRAPYFHEPGRAPRYYQDISIHRATEAILKGKRAFC